MKPLETIQAAIEKLTELRNDASPGPWTTTWGSATIPAVDSMGTEDADLIAALHRTIDAQLAILEWGAQVHDLKHPKHPSPLERRALGLAKAILGDDA